MKGRGHAATAKNEFKPVPSSGSGQKNNYLFLKRNIEQRIARRQR